LLQEDARLGHPQALEQTSSVHTQDVFAMVEYEAPLVRGVRQLAAYPDRSNEAFAA